MLWCALQHHCCGVYVKIINFQSSHKTDVSYRLAKQPNDRMEKVQNFPRAGTLSILIECHNAIICHRMQQYVTECHIYVITIACNEARGSNGECRIGMRMMTNEGEDEGDDEGQYERERIPSAECVSRR